MGQVRINSTQKPCPLSHATLQSWPESSRWTHSASHNLQHTRTCTTPGVGSAPTPPFECLPDPHLGPGKESAALPHVPGRDSHDGWMHRTKQRVPETQRSGPTCAWVGAAALGWEEAKCVCVGGGASGQSLKAASHISAE